MILMLSHFLFQVKQLTNFCRCCLLDVSKCDGPLIEMENETFDHAGEKINYFDGYLDVNNVSVNDVKWILFSEFKICRFCSVQLEIAFVFQKVCRAATDAVYVKYSTQSVAEGMIELEQSEENRHDETDDLTASSDHSRIINNKKVMINYALDLQKYKIQKEEYFFNNPSDDDFRRKLIKGGGVPTTATSVASSTPSPVSSASAGGDYGKGSSSSGRSDSKNVSSNNNSTSATNKHNKHSKTDEPKQMNSFKELFGPPINKTSKVSKRDDYCKFSIFYIQTFFWYRYPRTQNRQYPNKAAKQPAIPHRLRQAASRKSAPRTASQVHSLRQNLINRNQKKSHRPSTAAAAVAAPIR
jgi:hypothetical protein